MTLDIVWQAGLLRWFVADDVRQNAASRG